MTPQLQSFDLSRLSIKRFDPAPGSNYSLDITAHLTGVSRRTILRYCKSGLVQPIVEEPFGAFSFNEEAIRTIRHIEHLRNAYGINLPGLQFTFALLREIEQLRQEVRFFRGF